jgi:hypothetical protein
MQLTPPSPRPTSARVCVHLACFAGAVAIVSACGARTSLTAGDPLPDAGPAPDCVRTEDCDNSDKCKAQACVAGKCQPQPEVKCDDADPCTDDACDPATGNCVFRPASLDLDGDGHKGPRPGKKPGDPDACGDDCDDTSKLAYPGAPEVCDGVDNDCNGVVDDGAQYLPKQGAGDGVRVSGPSLERAYPGGLAHDGARYFADYTGTASRKERLFGGLLDLDGKHVTPEERLATVESDAYAGDAVWTGDRYAMVWEDRRFDNFEVFFAMFDANGKKMAPGDVRVSQSEGFSVNSSLVWTGREFVVAWQDGEGNDGSFDVWARRVQLDGTATGAAVRLTQSGGESPALAAGRPGLGVAFTRQGAGGPHVFFRPFDFELRPLANEVPLDTNEVGRYPSLVWNRDAFVVAWTNPASPSSIRGAVLSGVGMVTVPTKKISDSPRFARDPSLIPLGDRLVVVYADTRDQNSGFELYSRMFDAKLAPMGAAARITTHVGDSTAPVARLGPKGEVGVLFRDDREGVPQAYFTSLVCRAP